MNLYINKIYDRNTILNLIKANADTQDHCYIFENSI